MLMSTIASSCGASTVRTPRLELLMMWSGPGDMSETGSCACRLLQHNLDEARRIIQPPLPHIATFAEEQSPEMRDIIFDNFNTLAVLFRAPPSSFLQTSSLEEEDDDVRLPPLSAAGGYSSDIISSLLT